MKIVQTSFKYLKPLISLDPKKVEFIFIHHTASKTATTEQIHKWHLEAGFNGFGYNEYIRKDGTVYIGRGDHIGAQTKNMNSKSYGICVEGNYDTEKEMPKSQFNSLVKRIEINKDRFKNEIKVEKHSLFNPTSCPGKYFPFHNLLEEVYSKNNLEVALKMLVDNNIIVSPDYWKQNAIKGKTIKGEYAEMLIRNFANYIKAAYT